MPVPFRVWIRAFRLRTLPLALSTVFLGASVAAFHGHFNLPVFLLSLLTTLFLQILSNLANDYGDSSHGVDNEKRLGPKRTVQAGLISKSAMKKAVVLFSGLSLLTGLLLVFSAFGISRFWNAFLFICLGLAAIAAAIKYTVGRNPYGYAGFGDLAVFVFFGLLGVAGTYFLMAGRLDPLVWLPAASAGLFSVGVLNINNIRDRENDLVSGKNSLVVKIGLQRARIYHLALIGLGFLAGAAFMALQFRSPLQGLFLLSFPLFLANILAVFRLDQPALLDPLLKKLSLTTLLFSLLFGGSLFFLTVR